MPAHCREEPSPFGPQLKPKMMVGGGLVFMGTSPGRANATATDEDSSIDTLEGIDLATPSQTRRRARPSREERRSNSAPVPNMLFAGNPRDFSIHISKQQHEAVPRPTSALPTLHEANHSQHSSQ